MKKIAFGIIAGVLICAAIFIPKIGMTSEQVKKSTWSEPKKINKSTYSWGTSEQWCYPNYKYIYLDNDVVTAIQE